MCSKYNRFLLSSCLPVMALSLCLPTAVHAGFEWTPPEKTMPVEVMPEPDVDMSAPVSPDPVMSEELTEDTAMEEEVVEVPEEPPIEITVIEEAEEEVEQTQEAAEAVMEEAIETEEVEIVIIEETEEEPPVEMVVIEEEPAETVAEIVEEPAMEEAAVEEKPMAEEHHQENVVSEAMDIETSEAPVKDMQPEEDSTSPTSLSINPYPLEEVVAKAETTEVIHWNTPQTFDVYEGFGKDMPLALALRQIVPAQYAFSFGDGVSPGMRISWQGGDPWNKVLSDALAPHGVAVSVQNTKVLFRTDESVIPQAETPEAEVVEAAEAEAPQEETIHPEFENDVAAIEEAEISDVTDDAEMPEDAQEAAETVMEEAVVEETAPAAVAEQQEEAPAPAANPEEAMNDALREVYGTPPAQTEENMPDAAPLKLDGSDDKGASNIIIEEVLEPVEITEEQEKTIPTPDMEELSDDTKESGNAAIERTNILDPGPVESIQPSLSGEDAPSEEKKK